MKVRHRCQLKAWANRLIRVGFALAVAAILCQFDLNYLEALTYDFRTKFKPQSRVSGHIETIAIDPDTLRDLQREPRAKDHLKFIQQLEKAKPRAVVYILDPSEIQGTKSELSSFADEIEKLPAFYYGANLLPKQGHENLLSLPAPLDNIPVYPAPKTSDLNIFAKDGVTRRFIFSFDGSPTLHPLLARGYNGLSSEEEYKGIFEFIGTKQGYIDFRPSGTYPLASFVDIVDGSIDLNRYHDKIVIVGKDTLETAKDYIRTPFSNEVVAMTNIEMHANIFDTLIRNSAPIPTNRWQNFILTALISILTVYVVLAMRPTSGLFVLAATMAGFVVLSYLLFWGFHIWIRMAHPMLAIFICYYFFIPYRLIMENRRSWEYYQRNKLLTQVEELKSNFLRMMSHDLKTPLARIQGMTDVVMTDSSALSESQRKALATIMESSEELSEFIGSILNLGRIESKDVKLHLKSKDVNALLKDVIKKCDYLAQRKGIEIMMEFEPLFSVKADEDLLKQVFTNLVENAVKYSPENTKILISTEEMNGQIIVQVADQGRGIPADELPNVFSKFYRTSDVKNTEIGGSGLGLYLAKYFVELHQGFIEVESDLGKGSTFTVNLPMDA